jgi:hypothetical protein
MRTEIVLLARDEAWANTATVCLSQRAEAAIADRFIVQNFDSEEIARPRSATRVVLDRRFGAVAQNGIALARRVALVANG